MRLTSSFKILLVEDNAESRAAAEDELQRQFPDAQIDWAGDLESAKSILASRSVDLAVCDLKIPARPGELTTSEANGLAVVSLLQEQHPGTPIIILSAYGTMENTEPYTAAAEVLSAYGVPDLRMCQAANKGNPAAFESRLRPIKEGLASLEAVDFEAPEDLDHTLMCSIAQFAAVRGFSQAEVTKAGGLSGSANAIVALRATGRPIMRVFAKANDRHWLLDELHRQREFVEGYLDASNFAHTIETLRAGLRDKAAYFSSLASDPMTLFQLAAVDEARATAALERLESAAAPWKMNETRGLSVGALRRLHASDEELASRGVFLDEFAELEELELPFRFDVTHGDLHGENVLVVDDSRPVMVDFAYTEVAPGVLDPVTLEMSFLFHPESPLANLAGVEIDGWATGLYAPGSRFEAVLTRCRHWALKECGADQFNAMSYAHAMRHVKRGIPVDQVLALARSSARALGF